MADISVNFAGVNLANPIILASGGPGWDGEHLKMVGLAGAGDGRISARGENRGG